MITDPNYLASHGDIGFSLPIDEAYILHPIRIAFAGRDHSWSAMAGKSLKWLSSHVKKLVSKNELDAVEVYRGNTAVELDSTFGPNYVTLTLSFESFRYATITFKKEK